MIRQSRIKRFKIQFKSEQILFFGILAVGIGLRVWHIDWSLPELFEEARPLTISWKFWNEGKPGFDFNPYFFNYPALTFYLQFFAQVIHYGIGNLLGIYQSVQDFGATMTPHVVTARLVDLTMDIGVISLVYLIGKEIAEKKVALIAAALIALNPLHIEFAHLIQVDTALTFFGMLAFLFIYRVYKNPQRKWYILAGISIGLAMSSKYTGAFLLPFLITAHLLRHESLRAAFRSLKQHSLLIAGILSVIVFFAINPYILITPSAFQEDFSFEQHHMAAGHLGLTNSQSSVIYYLFDALPSNFGWIFFLFLVGTIVQIFIHRQKRDYLLLIYPLLFFGVLSTWEMRAERYILPLFPIFALIGAIGFFRFWEWLREYINKRESLRQLQVNSVQMGILIFLGIVMILPSALNAFEYLHTLGLTDTRTITKNWIKENLDPGSYIATGPFGIRFPEKEYTIFNIPFLAFEVERVAPFYDSRWYEDFDMVIASSYDYDRYATEPEKYRDFLPYYDSLRTHWQLLFETKNSKEQTGPIFWLYRCPDSLRKSTFDQSLFQRFAASPESSRISNFLKGLNQILTKSGKLGKCEVLLKEILSVEVENIPLRNQLGEILFRQGKYETALGQLGISIQRIPDQPQVYLTAGSALRHLNKLPQAEVAFNKAIEYQNNYEEPYLELIQLYKDQNERMKLLNILKRYYRILPKKTPKADGVRKQIQELQYIR